MLLRKLQSSTWFINVKNLKDSSRHKLNGYEIFKYIKLDTDKIVLVCS
jgi:hypothetical protein